jgi:hypothetical protein
LNLELLLCRSRCIDNAANCTESQVALQGLGTLLRCKVGSYKQSLRIINGKTY